MTTSFQDPTIRTTLLITPPPKPEITWPRESANGQRRRTEPHSHTQIPLLPNIHTFNVEISFQDRPETVQQKIRAETTVFPFYITSGKSGRVQLRYANLKTGGGLTLHRDTKTGDRENSRGGHRTSDRLPDILAAWSLASADDIFGAEYARIAPRLPKPDSSKATFDDVAKRPDDFPILDPAKWVDSFTLEMWKLSKFCSHEYALVHLVEIVEARYQERELAKSRVVEALTADVKRTKQYLELMMEDEGNALEVIRARGVGERDVAIRGKGEEEEGEEDEGDEYVG
ncbi:hypothetical protein K491DRAFT_718930 [Lophiostoma macrostomum CBS 122681]|uniref:Uncharacterized protein n=1 Tax=Lophiostoma macrostomum CBS 122681 TaxID=1314788 RepID=A0A6A6T0L2_9PLEO|nr:hypothetical protein K491DRAFT_718930 [Lophiostoma macrostomum CBS 122681]